MSNIIRFPVSRPQHLLAVSQVPAGVRRITLTATLDVATHQISIPTRVKLRGRSAWIDNPLLDICLQWKALREEAIAELKRRDESPRDD
jgi:hypothetical protein